MFLGAYSKRIHSILNRSDNGKCSKFAGLWILGRYIFDVNLENSELSKNFHFVTVTLQTRPHQHFYLCTIRSDPGQANGG